MFSNLVQPINKNIGPISPGGKQALNITGMTKMRFWERTPSSVYFFNGERLDLIDPLAGQIRLH